MTEPITDDEHKSTSPITPEVKAAAERLRDARNGDVPWEYAGTDGIEFRENDEQLIINAMLGLLPPDVPEPWIKSVSLRDVDTPVTYRGLYFPLERIEVQS